MKMAKKFLASSLGALTLLSTLGLNSNSFATGSSIKSGLSTRAKVLFGLGGTIGIAGIVTAISLVLKSKSRDDSSNSELPSEKPNVNISIGEEPKNLSDNEKNQPNNKKTENLDNAGESAGWNDPNEANAWESAGWNDPNEANEWKAAGWNDPNEASAWKAVGWSDPNEAYQWFNAKWSNAPDKEATWSPEYANGF